MRRWATRFVGREPEMDALKAAWAKARGGEPQCVALVADSGFGKTRIAQEFFGWLSTHEDGVEGAGYWPDRLLRVQENLEINADPSDCAQDGRRLPFLWWGVRMPDLGDRNAIATRSALGAELGRLTPHLAALDKRRRLQAIGGAQADTLAAAARNIAFDASATALEALLSIATFGVAGIGKTMVETGLERRRKHREREALIEESAAPGDSAQRASADVVDLVLAALRSACHAPPAGLAPAPVILLIDDVQWLDADETAGAFLNQMVGAARREGWRLLLVLTCWEREWRLAARGTGGLATLRASLDEWAREVGVGKAPDLADIVAETFPGLPAGQRDLFVEQADGSPDMLDALLAKFDEERRWWVDRSTAAALTEAGENELRDATRDTLVAKRLRNMPGHVHQALAAASLQGVRFSPPIAAETARRLAFERPEAGLSQAETDFAFLSGATSPSAEFRRRQYQGEARILLADLIDDDAAAAALQVALANAAAEVARAPAEAEDAGLEALIASIDVTEGPLSIEVAGALAEAVRRAVEAADHRTAAALAGRWLGLWETGRFPQAWPNDIWAVTSAWGAMHGFGRTIQLLRNYVDVQRPLANTNEDTEARRNLSIALNRFGDAIGNSEGLQAAFPAFSESVAISRELALQLGTTQARRDLAVALDRLGQALCIKENAQAALPVYKESMQLCEILADTRTLESRRDFIVTLNKVGDTLFDLYGAEVALGTFELSLSTSRDLACEISSPESFRDLSVALNKLGDAVCAVEGTSAARRLYEESLEICEALATDNDTPEARRDLSIVYNRLASVSLAMGDPEEALRFYESSLALVRRLTSEIGTPRALRDLSFVLGKLGDISLKLGRAETARHSYIEALEIRRDLVSKLGTADAWRDMSVALDRVADVTLSFENAGKAHSLYLESLGIRQSAAGRNGTLQARRDLYVSYNKLAGSARRIGDIRSAAGFADASLRLARALHEEFGTAETLADMRTAEARNRTVGGVNPAAQVQTVPGRPPSAGRTTASAPPVIVLKPRT